MKKILLIFALLLVLTPIVMAEKPYEDYRDTIREAHGEILKAREGRLECVNEFALAQIQIIEEGVPNAPSFSEDKETLNNDISELKTLSEENDWRGFNSKASEYRTDLRETSNKAKEVKIHLKDDYNLTREEIQELRDQLKEKRETYHSCMDAAEVKLTQTEIDFVKARIDLWNAVIEDMKEKEFDTTEMEKIVEEAETEIITPLTEAMNTGDSKTMRDARKEERAKELHLPARIRITQTESVLNEFEQELNEAGYEEQVKEIKENLETAKNLAVPGHKYENGEHATVWDSIHEARKTLREIIHELNTKGEDGQ